LQFEIGIQTFNPEVQKLISRRQKNDKAQDNIRWLRQESSAYLHTDLIFGLPSDDINSFADSFDLLYSLKPQEIQVGILKRLKGSPIIRHAEEYQLRFNPQPPFNILSTRDISFAQMQQMNRFARFWDMLANSGRFRETLPVLIDASPFNNFMLLSNELFARLKQTHKISLLRLFDAVFDIAIQEMQLDHEQLLDVMQNDFQRSGQKSLPKFLKNVGLHSTKSFHRNQAKGNQRQLRHS